MSTRFEYSQEQPRPDFSSIYPWAETPQETVLRGALSESVMQHGGKYTAGESVILSRADLAQPDALGTQPDDIKLVERISSTAGRQAYTEILPGIGLAV